MGGYKILKPDLIDVSKIKNKKIVAFSAHADDIEFLAAGTLLKLGRQNDLRLVVVTDGQNGTHDFDQDKSELVKMRQNEARITAKMIEAKNIKFWSYPDLSLQNRRKHLLKKVVTYLLKEKPEIVFCFDPWGRYEAYVHPDHRALADAVSEGVMMSTLPKWVRKYKLGNRFLTPKPQMWLYAPGEANVAVEVTDVWESRLKAVEVFISQFDREVQWIKVSKMLANVAERVGEMVGVKYAEGFRILEYSGEYS